MKRPLAIVALFYTAGILLADNFHLPLAWLFGISFALAGAAIFLKSLRIVFVVPLLILAGWTNFARCTDVLSPNDLRRFIGQKPEMVVIRGTLGQSPSERIFERDGEELWRSSATVETENILRGTNWLAAFGKLIVTVPGVLPTNFFSGQSVEIRGILQKPRGALAEGLFDPQNYLRRKEIFYQLQTSSTNDWKLADGAKTTAPIHDRFFNWAKKSLAIGSLEEDPPLRLLWTLAMDWKAPLTEQIQEPFLRAGTFHIFAVDGLRIAIMSMIFIGLFRLVQIPRIIAGVFLLVVIWFYTHLTGMPASAIRAAIMMTMIVVGWMLNRPSDLLNSLFAAAFIILVWDPQQLFQAGFQLSFFVVLCIALLLPPIRKWREKIFPKDPYLPDELRPRWRRWLDVVRDFCFDIFASSLAAWLGSIPLSAYYFHLFTPVSTPANFVVVPLTMLALITCVGSLITAPFCPFVAELFNHSSWLLMKWIINLSQWTAQWPSAFYYVSTPSPITLAWSYLIILTVLTGWIFRSKFKRWVFAAIAVLTIALVWQWNEQRKTTALHVLPMSGGHAVFVDAFGNKNDLLVDCGNETSVALVTKPFLHAQGINRLGNFALTHGDLRQVGGAENIATNFLPKKIFTSSTRARSPTYRDLVSKFEKKPDCHGTLQAGDQLGCWQVLHPGKDDFFPQADDNALVLLGKINGATILLLSDLGRAGQSALLDRNPNLHADIVIAGLPTEGEPLNNSLLALLQPKVVVITDSEFPATRRASKKLRERLLKNSTQIIFCRDAGALSFSFRPAGWELRDTRDQVLAGSKRGAMKSNPPH